PSDLFGRASAPDDDIARVTGRAVRLGCAMKLLCGPLPKTRELLGVETSGTRFGQYRFADTEQQRRDDRIQLRRRRGERIAAHLPGVAIALAPGSTNGSCDALEQAAAGNLSAAVMADSMPISTVDLSICCKHRAVVTWPHTPPGATESVVEPAAP